MSRAWTAVGHAAKLQLGRPIELLAMIIVASPAFWNLFVTPATAAVTLGRVELVGLSCGLATFLVHRRGGARPRLQLAVALAGVTLLAIVIVFSLSSRGVPTSGALQGYLEVGATLTGISVALEWGLIRRPRFLWAAALGSVIIAVLALAGVNKLHTSVVPVVETSDRLGGIYGNPNFLGFALVPAIPLILGRIPHARMPERVMVATAAVILVIALYLTYSRGALIGLLAAVVIGILWTGRSRRRRALYGGLAFALLTLLAIAVYGPYDAARTQADLSTMRAPNASIDASGWDANGQGLLPDGPAHQQNDALGRLIVVASRPGEGVSHALPPVLAQRTASVLLFVAASPAHRVPFSLGLEDNLTADSPTHLNAVATTRRRKYVLRWRPLNAADNARVYVWARSAGTLILSNLRFCFGHGANQRLSTKLDGPVTISFSKTEAQYVRSRVTVARLAIDAFGSSPFLGIGWQRFDGYAAAHGSPMALATHDEYLRIAAELGTAGLIPLLLVGCALGNQAWRLRWATDQAPVIAAVVAGLIGLAFVNGLETPDATIPFVAALAMLLSASERTPA